MTLKAILFDLDGTLVNTDPIHLAIFAEILAPLGYQVDELFFRQQIAGGRNEELFKRYFPQLSDAEIIEKGRMKERLFRERATEIKPMPGLDKLLKFARERGLRLALVTNAPRLNVDFLLSILNLENVFDIRVIGDEMEKAKPNPDPYLVALERLGITPGEAVVFEDSNTGVRSAVAAGVFTYGLMSTHPASELRAVGADMVISSFDDPALWEDLLRRI